MILGAISRTRVLWRTSIFAVLGRALKVYTQRLVAELVKIKLLTTILHLRMHSGSLGRLRSIQPQTLAHHKDLRRRWM